MTGRIFAILAVLMLVASVAPLPFLTEEAVAQGQAPDLRVTLSDYATDIPGGTPGGFVFGLDAFAYVVLQDPAWSVRDARGVVPMMAQAVGSTVEFDLLETGIGTGVFLGGFGFTDIVTRGAEQNAGEHPVFGRIGIEWDGTDWVAKNAQVKVDPDAPTKIQFGVMGESNPPSFTWHPVASAGPIVVTGVETSSDGAILGYGQELVITLDPDEEDVLDILESNVPGFDSRLLRVFSESQRSGVVFDVLDDRNDDNEIVVGFEPVLNPANKKLFVQDGDRVWVEYTQPFNTAGERETLRMPGVGSGNSWYFRDVGTPSISTDRSMYFGHTDPNDPHARDRAIVTIIDDAKRHEDGTEAAQVGFHVGGNPFQALQTGPHSNTFVAEIQFGTTGCGVQDADDIITLCPSNRQTFQLAYNNAQSTQFTWRSLHTGVVSLLQEGTTLDQGDLLIGTDATVRIRVQDTDSSRTNTPNTVTAKVKSTSDPDNGLTLSLLETGSTTGRFEGTFSFSTQQTGNGNIHVSDGDWIVVEFNDPLNNAGHQELRRSDYVQWRSTSPPGLPNILPIPVDTLNVESIGFFLDAAFNNPATHVSGNQKIHMRVVAEPDNTVASTRVVQVPVETEECDLSDNFHALLRETSAGSGTFTRTFSLVPGGDCGDSGSLIPVSDAIDLMVDHSANAGFGLFDLVRAYNDTSELPLATLGWWPTGDAGLTVEGNSALARTVIGGGAFEVTLTDPTGFPHRKARTASAGTTNTIPEPWVQGTELVYVTRTDEQEWTSGTGTRTFSLPTGVGSAAESVARDDGLGPATCADVAIVGTQVSDPPVGNPTSSSTDVTCIEVDVGARTITYEFDTCVPEDGGLFGNDISCEAVITWTYRAAFNSPPANIFEYDINTNGAIRFGGNPPGSLTAIFLSGEREITVRSGGNDVSVTLEHDPNQGSDTLLVFEQTILVEGNVTLSGSQANVWFLYKDQAQSMDGGPGDLEPDHFRSLAVRGQWRTAQDAVIRVMTPDFGSEATGVVYGPGIPVEVQNVDSNLFDARRDNIMVAQGGVDFTLWETSSGSGIFRGVVDGLTTAGQATITFQDPHNETAGTSETRQTSILWRPSAPATITAPATFQGTSSTFAVTIADPDANTNPNSVQSITARLASDSDRVGRSIQLVETGPDTGIFESTGLRFTTNPDLKAERLLVQDGDTFWVSYADRMDAGGKAKLVEETGTWRSAALPAVAFDSPFHIGTGDTGFNRLQRANVTIDDHHRSVNPRGIDVLSFTSGDFDGANLDVDTIGTPHARGDLGITFVETAHNSGVFIGTFEFIQSTNSCPNVSESPDAELAVYVFAQVCVVSSGDEIVLTYVSQGATADSVTTWYDENHGLVRFDRVGYGDFADKAEVIVYDRALNPHGTVMVRSGADPDGLELDISGVGEGVLSTSVQLSQSASSTRLHVNKDDTIEAEYQSVAGATRTASSIFLEGLDLDGPPVSQVVVTLIGSDCQGLEDWSLCPVEVTFEPANRLLEHVQGVQFTIDGPVSSSGTFNPQQPSPVPIGQNPDNEGIYEIRHRTTDIVGRVGPLETHEVKLSLKDPEIVVAAESLQAESLPEGVVELSWDPIAQKEDPLVFGAYQLRRVEEADTTVFVDNTTDENHTDLPPSDDPPQLGETFTYFVHVMNEAGRLGPASEPIEALSDRVAPRLAVFQTDKDLLHEEQGEDTVTGALTVEDDEENLEDIVDVFMRVVNPFGSVIDEIEMEPESPTFYAAVFDEFDPCGVYNFFGVARDFVGNEGTLNQTVRYVAIDRHAPELLGMAPGSTHEVQQGQDFNVTVVDNCSGVASISYTINGGTTRDVTVPARQPGDNCTPGPCRVSFQIAADRLAIGANEITFTLADRNETANTATVTITVLMVLPPAPPDPPLEDDPLAPPTVSRDDFSTLVEAGGRFRFSVSGQQITQVLFQVEADGQFGPPRDVIGALVGDRVRVDVDDLETGQWHTVRVEVINLFGSDEAEFTFYVLEEGVPLPPVGVTVEADDRGRPVISWQQNPDSVVDVGGYVVHRASSPWRVIAVTDGDTFSHTDTTAAGKRTYQYAVTAYGTDGQGRLEVGDDSEDRLPWFQDGIRATAFETDDVGTGIPAIVWWVLLVVLAVLVVVGLLYVNRRQIFGSGEEELYAEEYPDEAESPFGEERHLIRCPNCSEEFHVNGERPVVTDCPNCGRKGILR